MKNNHHSYLIQIANNTMLKLEPTIFFKDKTEIMKEIEAMMKDLEKDFEEVNLSFGGHPSTLEMILDIKEATFQHLINLQKGIEDLI